jgi:nicotinamidase-related amidase
MAGRTALVVIDVQVGMFDTPGQPPVPDGEHLLDKITGLIAEAREAGAPVVYVQHCEGPGEPLAEGTEGWEIHPLIAPLDGDVIVKKRTPDSFLDTALGEELGSRNIKGLVLAGMQTEYCVDTTCRRAFSLGYDVTLVKDAHGTWDGDDLSAAQIIAHHNEVLGNWFAMAVSANEVRFEEPATK